MNFVEALKANAPPPSGTYLGSVIGDPRAINDSRRTGVRFVLEIEGGRRATIELITALKVGGNRARVLGDLQALEMWCDALGVDNASTLTELIAKLRDAAIGKRVEFDLVCRRWQGGIDISLIGVRLAP
jgi:hypothetical protein